MVDDWISTSEAAELAGCSVQRIRQLIRKGKISATRKGSLFWIDGASLLAFLSRTGAQASEVHSKRPLPPESNYAIPHSATPELQNPPNSSGRGEATNESEAKPASGELDLEVEKYMQMVGGLVYDIVRDWLAEHHPERLAEHQKAHQLEKHGVDSQPPVDL